MSPATFKLYIQMVHFFFFFERRLLLHLFDEKYSKISNEIKIFYNAIYPCHGKAEFSASLLQSSVSHDPSEIIWICYYDLVLKKHFLIII